MTELTALEILKAARAKIADPRNWGKGMRQHREVPWSCCAAEAIEEAALPMASSERHAAFRALYNAAGLNWRNDMLTKWNDALERTHAEVLAAFNLAIATLRLS